MHVNMIYSKLLQKAYPRSHILFGLLGTITALFQEPEPPSRLQEIQTHRPLA